MKRKFPLLILVFAALISLCACMGEMPEEESSDFTIPSISEAHSTTETTTESTTETTTETTTEKITTVIESVTTAIKKTTTAVRTTTKKPTTTKPRTSTGSNNEGVTEVSSRSFMVDLKYGVDCYKTVETTYGYDANGKKYVIKEETVRAVYERSTYVASYSDLLPAAQQNRVTYSDYINKILEITNQMRAENGLAPLVLDEKLTEQACVRAEEIAWSGKHSHYRPNTRKYTSLFKDNGFNTGVTGENIGWYYATPEEVCNAWRSSEGHYANIMNPQFTRIGIGVAPEADPRLHLCWAQHFYSG